MAEEANRDLAVLGFSVNAKDAITALGKLDRKIRDIDEHFGAADISLEKKINGTLDKMAKSIAGLDKSSQSIAEISAALTSLANVSTQLGTLPEITNTIAESVKAMKNSGLEKLAKSYSQSLNKIGTAFAGTNDNIEAAMAKMRDIFIKPIGTKGLDENLKDVIRTLDSAKKAFDVFLDSANPKKLPTNVAIDNVRNASKYIGGLIHQVKQYQSATNNALQDPTQGERWEAQADVIKTTFNEMRGQLDKTMKTLMPEHGTVKVNVVFSNLTEQLAKIPSQLTMGFTPEAETRMQGFVASVESLGKDHQLKVDFADGELQKVQDKLDAIFKPVISFAGTPEDTAKKFFDDVQKYFKENKLRMPVKLVLGFGATRKPMASDGDETQEVKKTVEKVQKEAQKEVQKVVEQAAAKEPPKPTLSPLEQWKQDLKTAINQNEAAKKVVEDAVGKFGSKNTFSSMYDYVAMMGDSDKGWLEYFRELLEKLKMTREEMDAKMAEAGFAVDGLPKVAKKKPKAKSEPVKVEPVKVEVPSVKVEPTPEAKKETTESIADMVDPNSLFEQVKAKLEPSIVPLKNLLTFTPEITFTQESEEKAKNAIKRLLGVVNSADAKKISNLASLGAFDLTAYNQSLTTAKTGYDTFVAHVNDEVNKPQLSFAKNTQGGGIMTQLAKALEGMTVKPQNIIVEPNTITVDRSSSIMKFAQKDLFMPIDSMSVEPTTIWVDKANAEVRLLQVQLVADWPDVVVHPQNIFVDTASVPVEKIKAANGAAELPLTIKKAKVTPQSIKVDLSQVPKEKMTVTGGTVSLVPQSIKVDLPTAVQQFGIIKLAKPVTVSADIRLKPTSFTFQKGALNNIQVAIGQPINVQGYITSIGQVQNAMQQLVPFATNLATQLAAIRSNLSGGLAQLLTSKNVNAVNAMANNQQTKQQNQQKQQQALASINRIVSRPLNTKTLDQMRQRYERTFGQMVNGMYKKGGDVQKLINQVDKDITDTTNNVTSSIANADAALQATNATLKQNANAIRQSAAMARQARTAAAQTSASVLGVNAQLRQLNLNVRDLEHVTKLNLADPFTKMKAEIGDTGSRIADIGRMFGLYISGRSVINYFSQAAESANNFGLEIRRIQSLATDFDFTNLRNELMDIDARFGNVIHNAQALYWAYSSGVRGTEKELASFTETMSKTATTIKADVMPTVDAATSMMNAWNLSANSAAEIGDLLFSIIKYGKSNASQLTTSLGHVVAPAAALNLQLNELGASIAVLTKTMRTNRALTYLSNILGKMASPTKKVQEAAAEFGIELSANAIKARGFAQTLRDIREATGGDVGKIAKLFPDLRGQRAAITLLSTQYADFEKQLDNMQNKAGAMEEALSKITDTPEAQLKAIRNTISMISIGAGDAVNTTITLGGLLGPILKQVNQLEHGGRELLGHLTASVGTVVGMSVAMKAFSAMQFAAAKTAYELASAASETKRNELDIALLRERQALEANKMAIADANAQIAARTLNNEDIQRLKTRREILDESIRTGRQDVENARRALKLDDEFAKQHYENIAAGIGQSSSRLTMLRGLRVDETTGQAAKNMERDLAILSRLDASIKVEAAKLDNKHNTFIQNAHDAIGNYVMSSQNLNKQLSMAISQKNVDNYERYTKLLNTVVSKIKQVTAISEEMNGLMNGQSALDLATKEFIVTDMRKRLTEGTAFSHEMIVQFLDKEIDKENQNLTTLRSQLQTQIDADKVNADRRAQIDAIAVAEENVARLEQTRSQVVADIETKTKDLTQREQDYVRILQENVKMTKTALDNDELNVETLKSNIDLQLRNAAVIGRNTLSAVRATADAQLSYHSALMESRAAEAEILKLTDANKKLIDNTVANQQKLLDLEQQRVNSLKQAIDARKEYIRLGVLSGDADAFKARYDELKAQGASVETMIKELQRSRSVVTEATRKMSSEIGKGIFGGKLGGRGMQSLSMLTPFIPGLGKFGMGASMMASFDVFGKAASGLTRLTAGAYRVLGTTEKLQKKGLLPLDKGVEDLTRSVLTSTVSIKGMVASLKGIKALGLAGGSKALLAGLTGPTGIAAMLGTAVIGAVFTGLYYAFSQSEKGGPLGEAMEKLLGVDHLKQYGEVLDQRIEYIQQERESYASMRRELQRMLAIQTEQKDALSNSIVVQKEINAIREALANLDIQGSANSRRFVLNNQKDALRNMENEYASIQQFLSNVGYNADETIITQYQNRLKELEQLIPQQKAKIEQTTKELNELYRKNLDTIAEWRYQTLREMMENDADAAFAPMLDADGKLSLAVKSTNMALKRISSLMSQDKGVKDLVDLNDKSTDQIREMIKERVKTLSDNYVNNKLIYEAANKVLEDNVAQSGSDEYKEAEQKVEKLKKAMETSEKTLNDFQTNIRSAMNDYYQQIINQVSLFTNKLKEDSKQKLKKAKFNALFTPEDDSFIALNDIIFDYWTALNKLKTDFKNKAGIFKGKNDDEAQKMFQEAVRQLDEEQMQNITNNVNSIKQMQDNLTRFMETQANDMRQLSKQRFEYNMSNPALAGKRSQLIKNRMKELDSIMQPIIQQRDEAFLRAQQLINTPGQMVRAQAALDEAYKYENQVKGLAQEELELVKKRADIERGINASMFQLASTLQGKFESTAQTAVDAYSVESIRLQMRQIGENIAPPVQTSAQEIERKLTSQLFQRSIDNYNLLQQASLRLQQQISNQAQNADKMGNAAVTIQRASDTARVAAETFKRTVESNRTTFRVKRI